MEQTAAAAAAAKTRQGSAAMTSTPANQTMDASDCLEAIALAMRVLGSRVPDDGPFKLVGVTNLIKGSAPPSGLTVWELVFKPTSLIPDDASQEVGAGGEWIARIDLTRNDNPIRVVRGE
jgi:hypothetical protein